MGTNGAHSHTASAGVVVQPHAREACSGLVQRCLSTSTLILVEGPYAEYSEAARSCHIFLTLHPERRRLLAALSKPNPPERHLNQSQTQHARPPTLTRNALIGNANALTSSSLLPGGMSVSLALTHSISGISCRTNSVCRLPPYDAPTPDLPPPSHAHALRPRTCIFSSCSLPI